MTSYLKGGKKTKLRVADFSSETMDPRRKWYNIFYLLKEKNWQSRILYPVKTSFRNKREINTYSDEGKENLSSPDLAYKEG